MTPMCVCSVNRRRAFQRLARAAGTVVTLAQAFRKPLLRIHQQRAAVTLQVPASLILCHTPISRA